MDYIYISIDRNRAQELGLLDVRRTLKDGRILINQSDLQTYGSPEDSIEDKVGRLDGIILTPAEAKKLI